MPSPPPVTVIRNKTIEIEYVELLLLQFYYNADEKKILKFKNVEKKKQKTKINPIVNQSLPDGCRWVSASLLLCAGAWAHAPNQNDGDEAK